MREEGFGVVLFLKFSSNYIEVLQLIEIKIHKITYQNIS